ncbi:hypothetical protein SteCoe_38205 [Stentor coeruleus]|uniref:N-acetyltransferase domain-containing protein n=1 Tax=Stentor coeruleus TaxID=5963 RepID=A0A1R2ALP9_9CILI|nr:hypothetical protein SteCoe_38205 [Stentor coeruleus]
MATESSITSPQILDSCGNIVDLLYIEKISDIRKLPHATKDTIISEIGSLFEDMFSLSLETTTSLCLYQKSMQVFLILVREKVSNSLVGASIFNLYSIENLPDNSTKENNFIVPASFITVVEKYRQFGISKYIYSTFEHYFLQEYPYCNSIHFNIFSSPFSFHVLSSSAKFSFPDTLGTENKLLESFMLKAFNAYNRPYKKS